MSDTQPWQGALPIGWQWARVSRFFDVTLGKMLDQNAQLDSDGIELPYIRAANIQPHGLELDDVNTMRFTETEAGRLDIRKDDLLVVEGGSVGINYWVPEDMPGWSFQKTVNRIRASGAASTRFLGYVLDSYISSGVFSVGGKSTIAHLTAETLRTTEIPVPSLATQRAIANFLDRETAEIDAFIADQERLIELLEERRDAVLATAIRQYPFEASLGWLSNATLGKMLDERPAEGEDQYAPYLRAASIQPNGQFELETAKEMRFTKMELERLTVNRQDVMIVEGGVGGFGRAALVTEDMLGWGFQNSIIRLRFDVGVSDPAFYTYVLLHLRQTGYISMVASVTSMPHYTVEKVAATRVPAPPLERQRRIAAQLDEEFARTDALVSDARRAIELSRERRAALISAAVTGQLAVRPELSEVPARMDASEGRPS